MPSPFSTSCVPRKTEKARPHRLPDFFSVSTFCRFRSTLRFSHIRLSSRPPVLFSRKSFSGLRISSSDSPARSRLRMSPSRRAIQLTSRPPVLRTSDSQKSKQGSYRQIPRHFSSLRPQPIRLYGSISSHTLHIFLNQRGCTFCPSQLYGKAPPEYRYSSSGQLLSVRP